MTWLGGGGGGDGGYGGYGEEGERERGKGGGGEGEGGGELSWMLYLFVGMMRGSITKRRGAWHEQCHANIIRLFDGVVTSFSP